MNELLGVPSRFGDYNVEIANIKDAQNAPHSIKSRTLDESKVERRIAQLKTEKPNYNFLINNCSHMAMRALAAGMSENDRSLANELLSSVQGVTGKSVDHVGTVDKLADFVIDSAVMMVPALRGAKQVTRAVATVVAGLAGVKRTIITSPADVVRFMQHH